MTPELAPRQLHARAAARSERTQAPTALARRRRALLQLAERHGEIRVKVCEAGRAGSPACGLIDLLDELNEGGLLRYGGLHHVGGALEMIYVHA